MAQFPKTIQKDPVDPDATLEEVLKNIKFYNENEAKLIAWTKSKTEVVLTYENKV